MKFKHQICLRLVILKNDAKQTCSSVSTIKGIETHYEKVGDKYIVYRSSDRKVQKNTKYFRPNLKQFFSDEDLKRTSNDTKIGQPVNS